MGLSLHYFFLHFQTVGLTSEPLTTSHLWPNSSWHAQYHNASVPVLVSAVQNGHAGEAVHFLRNTNHFLPNVTVILYDLGLSSHEVELVGKYCNSSFCSMKLFQMAKFPPHVANLRTKAFR